VDRANGFVEERAPWTLAKQEKTDELGETLSALARSVARITLMSSPFMPEKTQAVWQALGLPGSVTQATWGDLEQPPTAGRRTSKPAPLFPKEPQQHG
jgi:methionyl-tRNA synthetase